MHLKPVLRPATHLELSLAECHLTGAGIPYCVHNRYTFGVEILPRVPDYNDCSIFVHPEFFDDAAEILAPVNELSTFNANVMTKIRILVEGLCFTRFVPARRFEASDESEPSPYVWDDDTTDDAQRQQSLPSRSQRVSLPD